MKRELLAKILENKNLQDIPVMHILKVFIAIVEEEYDNEK